ncbi:shikimate dehydrogenase [Methanosphaera sp. ISO3-F5]|uniref:shikimate dehydrogenase n=1 Tax=Methanosphaera sp. ISO3-F5 TaxID=1452353 RepID=UPI002B26025A|nr:shikimate dehydrogenase [Methanosphaera sp. ISO3-F5]WQH63301.1 shikimate dehydrogenase [Methanosphaera sp. ISO3-F5]
MITGKTKITGVIGHPIEHSMSPPMHNNAYKQLNMDYVYVAFHVQPENIEKLINSSKTLDIKGLNVTIPHKTTIIPYLDEIDETAEKIGAVNTIQFKNGIAKGYNTDGIGAIKSIQEHTTLQDKNILIIGAGGASKAISFTLINENINSLTIANRSQNNAENLINNIKKQTEFTNINYQQINNVDEILNQTDIIINTTPIGMYPNHQVKPPIKTDNINNKHVVMDIIYNPLETQLLKQAKENGATTINGTSMLINQGLESFKIFTGKEATYESFEEALLGQLKK